jgi:O-acetyl-ADP-ribose deacetylase (regulator of RNase III)
MMRIEINNSFLEITQGDITEQEVEAIVNAANERLIPGGGVDGAIHRKGGPAILEELRAKYTHCPTGEAVVTGAGNLKAKYVIHAVGPIYKDGKRGEAELLSRAYRSALERAVELGVKSIAFPALSTGAYGYPIKEASEIALKTILDFLKEKGKPELVRMVLFLEEHYNTFVKVLEELKSNL